MIFRLNIWSSMFRKMRIFGFSCCVSTFIEGCFRPSSMKTNYSHRCLLNHKFHVWLVVLIPDNSILFILILQLAQLNFYIFVFFPYF